MNKILKNNGMELTEQLGLDGGTLEHLGNYRFIARKEDRQVDIYTEPTDENNEYIRITGIEIDGEEYEYCEWCNELQPISEMTFGCFLH